jgi:hypothetical protein
MSLSCRSVFRFAPAVLLGMCGLLNAAVFAADGAETNELSFNYFNLPITVATNQFNLLDQVTFTNESTSGPRQFYRLELS